MITVRYLDWNGMKIFIRFDQLQIDPETTRKKTLAELQKTALFERSERLRIAMQSAVRSDNLENAFRANQEHQVVSQELEVEYRRLYEKNKTYFELRRGEIVPTDDEVMAISKGLQTVVPGELLTTTGEVVGNEA